MLAAFKRGLTGASRRSPTNAVYTIASVTLRAASASAPPVAAAAANPTLALSTTAGADDECDDVLIQLASVNWPSPSAAPRRRRRVTSSVSPIIDRDSAEELLNHLDATLQNGPIAEWSVADRSATLHRAASAIRTFNDSPISAAEHAAVRAQLRHVAWLESSSYINTDQPFGRIPRSSSSVRSPGSSSSGSASGAPRYPINSRSSSSSGPLSQSHQSAHRGVHPRSSQLQDPHTHAGSSSSSTAVRGSKLNFSGGAATAANFNVGGGSNANRWKHDPTNQKFVQRAAKKARIDAETTTTSPVVDGERGGEAGAAAVAPPITNNSAGAGVTGAVADSAVAAGTATLGSAVIAGVTAYASRADTAPPVASGTGGGTQAATGS